LWLPKKYRGAGWVVYQLLGYSSFDDYVSDAVDGSLLDGVVLEVVVSLLVVLSPPLSVLLLLLPPPPLLLSLFLLPPLLLFGTEFFVAFDIGMLILGGATALYYYSRKQIKEVFHCRSFVKNAFRHSAIMPRIIGGNVSNSTPFSN
jgi:hypothetical protein